MKSKVTITRPADSNVYTANDVVGDATGGVIRFPGVCNIPGGEVIITSAELRYDLTAVAASMTSFTLQLYRSSPASAFLDNAAWDLSTAADRAEYLGSIALGSPADIGSTLYVAVDQINKHVKVGDGETSIYAYLTTAGAYTPTSGATLAVTLYAVPV